MVRIAEPIPWWFGLCWYDHLAEKCAVAPVPLNYLARWARGASKRLQGDWLEVHERAGLNRLRAEFEHLQDDFARCCRERAALKDENKALRRTIAGEGRG